MGANFPLEHEDLSGRQEFAEMIVGSTVAQAELKHRPRQVCDPGGREVEAGTLRFQPADETVETTHSGFLGLRRRIATAVPSVNNASAQHRLPA
jgi:hypothetical protein